LSAFEQLAADAARTRNAMYRTAFGFGGAARPIETAAPRARRPLVLGISMLPFLASAIYAAFATPHIRQVWLFSCRLFGH
jgi:hypothetical protein